MQRWPPQNKNEKGPSSHPLFSPTPDEIRTLVLDYLCHNSYTGTARAFVRESAVKHLDADGDELMSPAVPELSTGDPLAETLEERLAPAEVRREIQTHLLSGRMDEAISLLNEHFPSVLSEEREPLLGADKSQPSTGFDYIPVTSVDPTHLALNLRIHAFIEAARTVPLPYHPPTALPTTPLSPSSPALAAASKLSVKGPSDPAAHQYDLLHRAQSLYAEAQSLVSAEARATYLVELSHVSGLLAYTDPENSPVSVYLKQERREAIARQVESAILYRTNKLPVSKIELYTRYTSVLWRMCNEYEVKVPPVSRWPAGVKLPGEPTHPTANYNKGLSALLSRSNVEHLTKKTDKPAAEASNVPKNVPKFDFADFLE